MNTTIKIKKQPITKMVEEAQVRFPQFVFSIREVQGYTQGKKMSSGVYYTPRKESRKGYKITVSIKTGKFIVREAFRNYPETREEVTQEVFSIDTTKTTNARCKFAEFCENHETFVHRRMVNPRADPVKPYVKVEFED